ncbi:hypothetical protein HOK31_26445, partial [Candidatus Poribacteria bacterium]|nr:hypothetical protein [Candidatus Poribacteria bacterium]
SQKVRFCLAEKGLEWKDTILDSRKSEQLQPEYLKLNPNGLVPTLVHDGNVIIDSSVILEYLDEVFPEIAMVPTDVVKRAWCRKWLRYFEEIPTPAIRYPSFQNFLIRSFEKLNPEEFETAAKNRPLRTDFYRRMVRSVVNHWKKPVLGGAIYDLDMRLRPYGRGGPMALTVAGYESYYRDHGELWERQATLKARVVAGSDDVGAAYMSVAAAFAYGDGLTAEEAAAIYSVRARKEDKVAREGDRLHNVKSGHGGVVDIEFLAQALQIRHGHADLELRSTNTVEAIDVLLVAGHLTTHQADRLRATYVFLRFVEDRLQIVDNRPMSALPSDPVALGKLTRRLGYEESETFLTEYHRRTEEVRDIFEDVFTRLRGAG